MAVNYIKILAKNYPSTMVNCEGDPEDYTHITWINSQIDQSVLDSEWLSILKNERYTEINNRTDELIPLLGFTYDNNTFKCNLEDRVNYGHIKQFEASLTFPIDIITKDEGSYPLTAANVDAFVGEVITHVNTLINQGAYYKGLIKAATTEAEVDAVVDAR
jgi:hypothetical protein